MPKKICCPKCKGEELQFVESTTKRQTQFKIVIALLFILSFVLTIFISISIKDIITNDLNLVTEKTWQKALEIVFLISILLSTNIAIVAGIVICNQRNKEAKIKAVCSYCGHSELLEKLTAPKKKYDYDEDEEE